MKMYADKKPAIKTDRSVQRKQTNSTDTDRLTMASRLGNQAMLAYLRGESAQTKPASNGKPLSDALREKFEVKSNIPLADVRVHYNSDKPIEIGAEAYAQGNQIFLGPGNEKHLEHETGHVVQQKQGLVKPTGRIGGKSINTNPFLETSATAVRKTAFIPEQATSSPANECIQGIFIQNEVIEKFLDYYTENYFNEDISAKKDELFNADNMKFASGTGEGEKLQIGSLYFTAPDGRSGGRIRLAHRGGPEVSQHNGIRRYVLSNEAQTAFNVWRKSKENCTFDEANTKIRALEGRLIDDNDTPMNESQTNADEHLFEIYPSRNPEESKCNTHKSRGSPVAKPTLDNQQINLLMAVARFSQKDLLTLMPYDRHDEETYYKNLKNDFLKRIMEADGIKIPIDPTIYE